MKLGKKMLSATLSLVLCGSLVAPSFAGTFTELQEQIDNAADGQIKLEEDYHADETTTTITIGAGQNVSLDLNGYTLTGSKDDSVITVNGNLTLDDTSENGDGKVTGGGGHTLTAQPGNSYQVGGGVYVAVDGSFTMEGGEISGNTATLGGGVFIHGGDVTMNGGAISENTVTDTDKTGSNGGGVYISAGPLGGEGSFTMTGGEISGNTSESMGGGVTVSTGIFTMTDGEISGNAAGDAGGVSNYDKVIMTGGEISGNRAEYYGGGVHNVGNFTMEGGKIFDNSALYAGGGVNCADPGYYTGEFTMNGGEISNNTATDAGDDIWNMQGAIITLPDAGSMGADLDGKNASGWYNDSSDTRWGDAYENKDSVHNYKDELFIKAAHDEYFAVTDSEGDVLAWVEKGTEINVSELEEPTQDGYTFVGWADEDGTPVETLTVTGKITLVAQWEKIEEPVVTPPVTRPATAGEVEIDEVEVPLAGLFTRADAIGYLWQQAGEPEWGLSDFEDVPEDHQWAVAIGWAQDMGIARADEEGNFRPDELVLRGVEDLEADPEGELQEFLNWYAQYAGVELDEGELFIELEGALDDVIMGEEAQVIFDDFFAKLEAALTAAAA